MINHTKKRSINHLFLMAALFRFSVLGWAEAVAAPFAYITNAQDNTVSVIDTVTNTVTVTVPVGGDPTGVAVKPNGTTVYVANYLSNTISVIDTATNTVTDTFPVGSFPWGVAVKPDSTTVYVTNFGSDTVSVIDAATNTVTDTIPVGDEPIGVAVKPDGTTAYVTNRCSNTVTVIDPVSNTVTATVPVETYPHGVAVKPDGTTVYVTNTGSGTVSVIDTATNTVTDTIPVGDEPVGVAFKPDGTTVYVANCLSDTVSVIDATVNAVTAAVAVGICPWGVAVKPDGTAVYVANDVDHTVSVIDTATNMVTATVPVGRGPCAFGQFITPAPCIPVPAGLVSWWPGDGNANDVVGPNNGALVNGATFAKGMVGQAFSFDGVDDYVSLPAAVSSLVSDSEGTLSAWVYPTSVDDNDIVVAFGSGNNGQGIGLGVWNTVRIYHHTGAYDWQSTTPVSANEWTLLTYTWDTTTERIYKNGVFSESRARNFSYVPGNGRIGHGFWGDGANAFPGRIDEVTVFSRALPVEEIAAIYAAGSSGMCIPEDTTPDPFHFTDQIDVPLNTLMTSDAITVTGVNAATPISVSSGEYEINGSDTWTSEGGTVNNSDTVRVRQTSSGNFSTTTDTTLTIGGVSDIFSVTTIPIPAYTITGSVTGGNGTINCTSPVNQGTSSTCTITPDTDYHLATLTDNGTSVIGSVSNGQYVINNVTGDHDVIGTFSIDTFPLSIALQGTGTGSVTSDPAGISCGSTCDGLFDSGTPVTLTATPAIGSFFAGWSGDCNAEGEVMMTAGRSCTATFTAYTALQVLAPNGGEDLMAGQSYTIRWAAPTSMETFNILYSLDGGLTWKKELTQTAGNSYSWTVPVPPGSANKKKCLVRVIGFNGQGTKVATDTSDGTFVINLVELDSLNGGQALDAGTTAPVTWTRRAGLAATTAKIYYSLNQGLTWVYSGQANTDAGQYDWEVPLTKKPMATCRVKVKLFNGATVVGSDKSDGNFTIRTVEVLDPNGGETLPAGQSYDVSYNVYARNSYTQADVYLSLDGGATWKRVGQQDPVVAPGPANLPITLPAVTTTKKKCKLKVQLVDEEARILTKDTSAAFTISPR